MASELCGKLSAIEVFLLFAMALFRTLFPTAEIFYILSKAHDGTPWTEDQTIAGIRRRLLIAPTVSLLTSFSDICHLLSKEETVK
jgi:hypothetical protein